MKNKRVFLIVLDSVGIGAMPDAADYGDEGSHTLRAAATSDRFRMVNMKELGLFHIDGVAEALGMDVFGDSFKGAVAKLSEASKGKDTTIGHWEISGVVSKKPLPTFPNGFPGQLLDEFSRRTGRNIICNQPYSGTDVIRDYGRQHVETGALIVYTSADSVFQIAAHEAIVPIEQLYQYCEIARELCQGEFGVGRVIARPFEGEYPYSRTKRRHDYSLEAPAATMLDILKENDKAVIAVGKIHDIFAGRGITEMVRTADNQDGIHQTLAYMERDFHGLCFTNLVDYDMLYGHRNDVTGYAQALTDFDARMPELLSKLREDDILMITADHGCDPSTSSTDHSREYVPLVIYGRNIREGVNLGIRPSFADIGSSIIRYFALDDSGIDGESFIHEIIKEELR